METDKIDGRTREARALRPPLRSDEPRRDAAARAKEIMDHIGGEFGEQADIFHIPADIIPDGWSYEWKEYIVLGKVDPSRQVELNRTGWEPVPSSRHPELMPGDSKEPHILRKGMRLMERPQEVTDMARKQERRRASEQMRSKKEQLEGGPVGAFESNNKGKPLSKVRSDFNLSMAVPD